MPLTTNTTPVVQSGIGALPTQIQQDYQAFFNATKPGSYTDFAGGVLYRAPMDTTSQDSQGNPVNQNRAIFYTPQGQEYTLTDKTDLNAIAYTIPEIAEQWKTQYGFTPTGQAPASGVMSNDNWNPIRQAYADADRNVYATDKDVIFDPQLRGIDLSAYKNNPHGAFEKLAMDVYGGKGMTMEDISRLGDATGAAGAYVPDPENPGKYKLTYADDISKSPYSLKSVPAQGLTFDQRVALERDEQFTGIPRVVAQDEIFPDKKEIEQAPTVDAQELYKQFGLADAKATPTSEGILSGFKYAKDSGISEASMKKALGEDVFNTYKTGFADYAKTGIASVLADNKLSFDEAREMVKFGRDYGYDSQMLADLTGQKKELFDTINTTYDDTTNKIVDSVLGAEDVKTNDDKIVKALALQNEYGFTDEDLAKAADFTPEQMKNFLDPVRNFGTEINGLLANTDSTVADTKKFIEEAKKNGAISKLYGEKLGTLDAKIAEIEDRWKDYSGVDPLHAQRVFDQIDQQRTALGDKYYQGTFGDPMKMAATLAKKGIDTLSDIGQKDKYETTQADAVYTTADGRPVQKVGDKFLVEINTGESTEYQQIPEDQIKTTYGRNEYVQEGDGGYNKFVPLTEEEQATVKDGKYEKLLGKVAYDKDTGKEIAGLDGTIESEKSGKSWNRKRNELNVGFTDSGVPILYTTKEKTGFGAALQQAMPLISFALPFMLPGIGAGLSSLLPGAGVAASGATAAIAPTLMNQALTQGIISGGLGSLTGQDFGKSFLSGAINPVINTGISSLLPAGMNPDIARAVTGAGSGVIKGALQGGDIENLLGEGILSGLTNYGLGEATKGLNLTPQQLNFATGIALPLIQGQKVNPMKVISTLAQSGQQTQKARP